MAEQIAHDHAVRVPGCFRCDLSRDEVDDDAHAHERDEQATERASAPMPAGRMVAGVWCENAPSRAEAEADLHG